MPRALSNGKRNRLSPAQIEMVCDLFSVFCEPSRLVLLQALHDGPLSVNELVEACRMKQANVSKQLAVLHDHRLLKREREGLTVRYSIADPMVFELCRLVCGKIERDTRKAAAVFNPEI